MEIISILLAAASLIVAIISLIKSVKAQNVQSSINEIELKLKKYELEAVEDGKVEKSCVEARIVRMGNNKDRLKIWNSGNTKVYNVSVSFQEGSEIIVLDSKMPFEELEPNKSFEEPVVLTLSSSRKFWVTTCWEDKNGEKLTKKQIVSI